MLLLAGMLFGGLLGDFFGRRRVLLLGAMVSAVAGVLALIAPGGPWFVAARSVEVAAGGGGLPADPGRGAPDLPWARAPAGAG